MTTQPAHDPHADVARDLRSTARHLEVLELRAAMWTSAGDKSEFDAYVSALRHLADRIVSLRPDATP